MIRSNELPEVRFIASREYEMFTSSADRGSKDFLGDCLIKIARELVDTRRDIDELDEIEKNYDMKRIFEIFGLMGTYSIKTKYVDIGSTLTDIFSTDVDMRKHMGLCVIVDRDVTMYGSGAEMLLRYNTEGGVHLLFVDYGNGKIPVADGREVLGVVMRNARFYRAPDVQKLYADEMVSSSARDHKDE